MYPKPVVYWVKLESGRIWHAANRPLSGSTTSVPTPSRYCSGWQSTGASLWVYRHVNHWKRAGWWRVANHPSFHTKSSSTPSNPEHLWSNPVRPSSTKHEGWSSEEPRGFAWHQCTSGSMSPEDAVDSSMTRTTRNSTLPHALTGKYKHFMPNTKRSLMGHY